LAQGRHGDDSLNLSNYYYQIDWHITPIMASLEANNTRRPMMAEAHLKNLLARHRALDRLIDTTKAVARQAELKQLKLQRLRLKDRIAQLSA
tara:strand:- start:19483 stop:19758 length:276 start_codon:yes stop_codon:yes gene_type:complete